MTHSKPAITAAQAYAQARPGRRVVGWKLDPAERDALLARFAPRYERTIADHVTLRARVQDNGPLPPASTGVILGRSDDGHGVEALVVQIDGTVVRPDGGTYHITWSLAQDRKPVESNDVIARHRWEPVDPPVPVRLVPAVF